MNLSLPQLEIFLSTQKINLFLAGVASGKTYLDGIISYRFISEFQNVIGFIGANTYGQLNTATFKRISEVWHSLGLIEYNEHNKTGHYVVGKKPPDTFNIIQKGFISYNDIVTFKNGSTIFLGSLDNAKAHEGKEFGWAILDETKDSKESDVKDIILARLRQKGIYVKKNILTTDSTGISICPLYISTSPAKVDWINSWFRLDEHISEIQEKIYDKYDYFKLNFDNKFCTISSTYHNEQNLPANYIEDKRFDWLPEKFNSLIFGNPFTQTGSEYYPFFNRLKHVKACKYNPDLPLHTSFDFNYVPYNSNSIWQIDKKEDKYIVRCIDEFALKNPHNSTEEVCEAIIARYSNHKSGLFIYGDATGRSRSTMNREYKNQFQIIEKMLYPLMNQNSMRVPLSNMPNINRRDFINRAFEGKLPFEIEIDEACKYMISDLTYTKQDSITGLKDKHIVKDSETGEQYQKYGHFTDGAEYFICEAFKDYFKS